MKGNKKTKDKWAGMQYYEIDGYWDNNKKNAVENYVVSVCANAWQSEHYDEQPRDEDIFFTLDKGDKPKVGERLAELMVTAVRKFKQGEF